MKLSQRVKTGDFAEEFAREANKLRSQKPTVSPQPESSCHSTSQVNPSKWLPFAWSRRATEDEERPRKGPMNHHGQRDVDSLEFCHLRRIPISCTRAPNGVNKELFILGVEDGADPKPSSLEERTLHWLYVFFSAHLFLPSDNVSTRDSRHIRHFQGKSFSTFVVRAPKEDHVNVTPLSLLRAGHRIGSNCHSKKR
jgi:hypothetical protein